MAANHFLQAEARERPRVAIVAALAALLTIGSPLIVQIAIGQERPDNRLSLALLQADHMGAVLASALVSVLGLLAITLVLDFLLRATRSRMPDLPGFIRPLLLVGGIGLALFVGILRVVSTLQLQSWADESTLTWRELERTADFGALPVIGMLAQFAFVAGFVLVVLNAMRAGLLTRFLGYIGAFSGILFVFPLLPLPVVQIFWLGAVALLLWGVGKANEPPAWRSGEAMPWPSAAELREQRVRAAEARRRGGASSTANGDEPIDGGDEAATAGGRRKRKKKR